MLYSKGEEDRWVNEKQKKKVKTATCGAKARPSLALPEHATWDSAVPFIVEHEGAWDPETHFGQCGQSCGCCRSHNPEDACEGCNCQLCFTAWVLSCVSRSAHSALGTYVRQNYAPLRTSRQNYALAVQAELRTATEHASSASLQPGSL